MPLTFRLYLCSHFTDAQIERDHLHRIVFPELQRRFASDRVRVEIVDLRREAHSEEDAESPDGLTEAFHKIGECRPWFLCLLGDRIGTLLSPESSRRLMDDSPQATSARSFLEALPELERLYPGLQRRLPASRLELEVWQGVLRDDRPAAGLVYCREENGSDAADRARLVRLQSTLEESGRAALRRYALTEDDSGLQAFGESVLADLSASMEAVIRALERGEIQERGAVNLRAPEPGESMEMTARIVQRTLAGRSLLVVAPAPRKSTPAAPAPEPQPVSVPSKPVYVDENVQFTVYRPRTVAPEKWYPLLAFAHLSERALDAPPDSPDPVEEVYRQAQQVLGAQAKDFQDVTQDSRAAVPREGELTLVPEVPGVTFNPPRRSFLWTEPVHREEFRLKADAGLDGKTVRGRLTVFLGQILLADVSLSFRVDSSHRPTTGETEAEKARPYRKIFASYSHKDTHIVQQVEQMARIFGDRYLRDWTELRAGEVWDDRLLEMIRQADVFQLFWSHHSMHSQPCRREWEYALSLNRPYFVRPTYWEEPLPSTPDGSLPPEELRRLHFQKIFAEAITHPQMQPSEPSFAVSTVTESSTPGGRGQLALQGEDESSTLTGQYPDRLKMPPPAAAAPPPRPSATPFPPPAPSVARGSGTHFGRARKRSRRWGNDEQPKSMSRILVLTLLVLVVLGAGVLWLLLGR